MSAFQGLKRESVEEEEDIVEVWEDVTDAFKLACEELGTGGMRKKEGFTLQDSMNALELMSPKMDAGMKLDELVSVRERWEQGQLSIPPRNDLNLLTISDLIMCMELAWFNGHSLATSVHSCVYFEESALEILREKAAPLLMRLAEGEGEFELLDNDSDESILAVVSLLLFMAVLKSCHLVRQLVRMADIYEEEDFIPTLQGLPLAEDVPLKNMNELLDKARQLLKLRQAKPPSDVFSSRGLELLLDVFQFRKSFVNIIDQAQQLDLKGVPMMKALLPVAQKLLQNIGSSRVDERDQALVEQLMKEVIDPDINKKILASSPPRARPEVSIEKAHKDFEALLANLLRVCELGNETTLDGLYFALLRLSEFNPCIVARSAVVPMLFSEGKLALGKFPYSEWIAQNMKDFGVPYYELESGPGAAFVELMVKPIYEVLRILTANRARQRRNLANILPEWALVQQEAELHDQLALLELRPELKDKNLGSMDPKELTGLLHFSMYSWSAEWTTRLMIYHLLLGFELELYSIYEYDIMFWYVSYLFTRSRDNRAEMLAFLERKLQLVMKGGPSVVEAVGTKLTIGEEQDIKKKRAAIQQAQKTILQSMQQQYLSIKSSALLSKEKCLVEIYKLFSDGLLRTLIALRKQGKLTNPSYEFGSPKIRYNHRFAPYANLSNPGMLSYESYEQVTDLSKYTAQLLFSHAKEYFDRSKDLISQLVKSGLLSDLEVVELKNLLKVVIANSLFILREKDDSTPSPTKVVQGSFENVKFFPSLVYAEACRATSTGTT